MCCSGREGRAADSPGPEMGAGGYTPTGEMLTMQNCGRTAAAAVLGSALILTALVQGCARHTLPDDNIGAPAADHHSHLLSPEAIALLQGAGALPPDARAFSSDDLIAALDSANVQRAVVASVGYFFATRYLPAPLPDERARLQAENDWNVQQAARHPGRLIVFCGLNPLREYAGEEVARCRELPHVAGIKMHFDNSGVDVLNAAHIGRLRDVFRTINDHGMAIIVHLRMPAGDYGATHSRSFIENVLAAAPDVPVQIAHLAGSGPGYDADGAFLPFAEAAARDDPALANVYFDVASSVVADATSEDLALIAERLRMAGTRRILFGSDYAGIMNEPPHAAWAAFRQLPLTIEELRDIGANVPPYLR